MSIMGNIKARKAYFSHTKAIQLLDQKSYKEAAEKEKKALAEYEEALKSGMSAQGYLMAYAVLCMRSGMFDKAMQLLNTISNQSGLKPEVKNRVRVNKGVCMWKMGQLDDAIEEMEDAAKNGVNSTIYGSLGYMYIEKAMQTGDWSKAEKFNAKALDYDDEDSVVLDNVAVMALRQGDRQRAKEYFEKALLQKPGQVDSLYQLAKLQSEDGDVESARKLLDRALKIHFSALATVTHDDIQELRDRLG